MKLALSFIFIIFLFRAFGQWQAIDVLWGDLGDHYAYQSIIQYLDKNLQEACPEFDNTWKITSISSAEYIQDLGVSGDDYKFKVYFSVSNGYQFEDRVVVAMTYPFTNINEYYGNVDVLACKTKVKKIPPHIVSGPWQTADVQWGDLGDFYAYQSVIQYMQSSLHIACPDVDQTWKITKINSASYVQDLGPQGEDYQFKVNFDIYNGVTNQNKEIVVMTYGQPNINENYGNVETLSCI